MTEIRAIKEEELQNYMQRMGVEARVAARILSQASSEQKKQALNAMAGAIREQAASILKANAADLEAAADKGLKASFVDRLTLNEDRVEAMAQGLEAIATFDDPVGSIIKAWDRPNGLTIKQVRTPLGVIGVIYESRPNVTADAGALCMMAGNAVILRGGSEGFHSNHAIHAALQAGLVNAGLPEKAIQLIATTNRDAVGEMLRGLDGNVDVIVPRGGKNLVGRVQKEARVPVFSHLEGLCHLYVDEDASLDMAVEIIHNAKLRRTGICGSVETVLIHEKIAKDYAPAILNKLAEDGCEIRGDEAICKLWPTAKQATAEDWVTEYLDKILSVCVVSSLDAATDHIAEYGSEHTDGIITQNQENAQKFFAKVDSAIVVHNASTQFADGGEFGMGAEIGIATGKMHARGPIGVEQLTSFQYHVLGTGQIRPA